MVIRMHEYKIDSHYNIRKPWALCEVKEARHKRSHVVWFSLYEKSRISKSIVFSGQWIIYLELSILDYRCKRDMYRYYRYDIDLYL